MKIKLFGYRGPLAILPAMEAEFVKQGHVLTDEDPDLIFDNNGFFEDAIEFSKKWPEALKIFNLLDIPPHNPNWPFEKARAQLAQADVITTISQTVADQMNELLGLGARVIYHPIRPVSNLNYLKTLDFIYVGRATDPNKRFVLIAPVLELLKSPVHSICVAGPDRPPFGIYAGLLPDAALNEFYNSAKYVFLPSAYEGIGLSMIEGVIAGAYPILCNDNKTAFEFGLGDFTTDPEPEAIARKIVEIQDNQPKYTAILDRLRPEFLEKFSVEAVCKRVVALAS